LITFFTMPPKKAAGTAKPTKTATAKTTTTKQPATKAAASTTKAAPKATKASTKAAPKATQASTKAASEASEPATKTVTKKSTTKTSTATPSEPKPKAAAKAPAKKSAAKKAVPVEDSTEPTTATSKKRKSPDTTENDAPVEKKTKTAKASAPKPKAPPKPKATPKSKAVKAKVVINDAPTDRLNVYVCGEGSSGELGLGNAKNAIDVKRPRLNANLSADTVGVVQVAVGGMHVAALTHDNQILTWGVNDQGALGRDTTWDGGLMDVDEAEKDGSEASEDSEDDSGLNPLESTPTPIDDRSFPPGTTFVQVAAGDSTTFALTDDGFVYGWGTFRVSDINPLGYS
jgi:regulator of chromosome condensation